MRQTLVILLVGFGAAMLPAGTAARAASITVSAAVSLRESLTDVATLYERQTGEKVELNFAATGHLLAQIREGAPVDVFIAASEQQMDQAKELIDPRTREAIVGNQLVLIVPRESALQLASFVELIEPRVHRVAIGQPRTVPAGQYASQVLERLKLGSVLKDRLILGSSVRQVLDYVERGEVDAGIVYATDAREAGDAVRVVATAQASWHDPIHYVAAVVSGSSRAVQAQRFIEFMKDEPAQRLFAARGFVPAMSVKDPSATTRPTAPTSAAPAGSGGNVSRASGAASVR